MPFQKEFHSIVTAFVLHWYAKEKQSHLQVTAFGCGKLKKNTIWKPKPGRAWLYVVAKKNYRNKERLMLFHIFPHFWQRHILNK